MSTAPQWDSVDNYTADLLSLVADTNHVSADHEWGIFRDAIRQVANANRGEVDQNHVRPLIRGKVAPRRVGAFYRRATLEGLIQPTAEWRISDDTEGRNAGRPMKLYRRVAA